MSRKQNKTKRRRTTKRVNIIICFYFFFFTTIKDGLDINGPPKEKEEEGTTGSLLFAPFVYTNREEERKMAYTHTHTLIYATKRGNPEGGPGRGEKGFV